MNMEPLAAISDIQIGYTARTRLEPTPGGVRALQLRDIAPDGGRSDQPVGRFRLNDIPDRYWVRTGDIVFRSRGDQNTATALDSEFGEPAVAVMPLVIVRAGPTILPEYLAWYLNQPEAQHHFDRAARGTGMRMIPMACLAELPVPVPDLETQRAIATVDALAQREFTLSSRLAERRRQLLRASLLRAARESVQNQPQQNTAALRPANGGTA